MSNDNVIKITEKARKHLNKKKKHDLTIEIPENRLNSESVLVPIPEILAKKPKNSNKYKVITIDGIDIYVSNYLKLPENDVIIDLDSFLGIKLLSVSGFKSKEM